MLGYATLDELRRRNLKECGFEPEDPRARFEEAIRRDGHVRGLEARWKRKDGEVLVVRENALAIRGSDGKVLFYEGTVEDVTGAPAPRRRNAASPPPSTRARGGRGDRCRGHDRVRQPGVRAHHRLHPGTRRSGQTPRLLKSGRHDAAFYRELWATITAGQSWYGHLVNRRKDGSKSTRRRRRSHPFGTRTA